MDSRRAPDRPKADRPHNDHRSTTDQSKADPRTTPYNPRVEVRRPPKRHQIGITQDLSKGRSRMCASPWYRSPRARYKIMSGSELCGMAQLFQAEVLPLASHRASCTRRSAWMRATSTISYPARIVGRPLGTQPLGWRSAEPFAGFGPMGRRLGVDLGSTCDRCGADVASASPRSCNGARAMCGGPLSQSAGAERGGADLRDRVTLIWGPCMLGPICSRGSISGMCFFGLIHPCCSNPESSVLLVSDPSSVQRCQGWSAHEPWLLACIAFLASPNVVHSET